MSQVRPKKKKKVHVRGGVKALISTGALIIGIMVALSVIFLGGPFLGPPTPPPEEYATGYYRIYFKDGFTRQYVETDEIVVLNALTLEPWATNISTGITQYTSVGSIFWCNVSGYYPVGGTLFASGGNDPALYQNNTKNIFRRADPQDITVTLIRWTDLSTLTVNYSQALPGYNGYFKFEIEIRLNEHARYNSCFGINTWVPKALLPEDTFAYNSSVNFYSLWIGFDAELSNYSTYSQFWEYNDVYDINFLNVTMHPPTYYEKTYVMEGYFAGLSQIVIWDRLIDDYTDPLAIIT